MSKTFFDRFRKNLKSLRIEQCKSQLAVATAIGLSRMQFISLETGKTKATSLITAARIASYFSVTIDEMLYRDLSRCPCGCLSSHRF
jgi:DNA-binding XRE family transcriptional regulator